MDAPSVLSDTRGSIRILTLNRPAKLNAATLELQQRFLSELQAVAADPQLSALVITGAGRAFSAGGDRELLARMARGEFAEREQIGRAYLETVRTLLALPLPVLAAVNGMAIGWGAGMAALCDVAIAEEQAQICDPHVKFGLPADPAVRLMWPRLTSPAKAKALMMSGRSVGAREALELGLVSEVRPAGQALAAALEAAEALAALPRHGVWTTKQSFNLGLVEDAEALIELMGGPPRG